MYKRHVVISAQNANRVRVRERQREKEGAERQLNTQQCKFCSSTALVHVTAAAENRKQLRLHRRWQLWNYKGMQTHTKQTQYKDSAEGCAQAAQISGTIPRCISHKLQHNNESKKVIKKTVACSTQVQFSLILNSNFIS